MSNWSEEHADAIVCLIGGCGFGAWQSSLGAGIFMTIALLIFAHLADNH
jgi:hypothetical protein